MKFFISMLACLLLVGCGGNTKHQSVIVKDHYIVRTIPAELFSIPAEVDPLNLNTATQKDVAIWIVKVESRSSEMEMKLRNAKRVQDENVKAAESAK